MSRKAYTLIIIYLTAAAVALGAYSAALSGMGGRYRSTAVYGYEHAFGEVVQAAASLDDALRRGSYATGPELSSSVCAEIYGCCLAAQMTVAALPFSTAELEQTAGFVGIAGDYAFSLIRSHAADGFGDTERKNMSALADISAALTESLAQLQGDIRDGAVIMDEPENVYADTSQQRLMSQVLLEFEGSFPELPELEYDGKYAVTAESQSDQSIAEDEAKRAAAELFGFDENELTAQYQSENGSFCFAFDGGTVIVDSQGRVLSMSSERAVAGRRSDAELERTAVGFIRDAGFDGMELDGTERVNDVLYADFVCTCGEVRCLREVIRVGVAADTGGIYSFDARQYVKNHVSREPEEPAVTEQEAKTALPQELKVRDTRLAYIETEGGSELLCYAFSCTGRDGESVTVYVDASTGRQYKIEL